LYFNRQLFNHLARNSFVGEDMQRKILDPEELERLDKQIDSEVPKQQLAQIDRDTAVLNSLLAYELNCGYGLEFDESNPRFSSVNWKNNQDALHFLIDWCYRFCQPSDKHTVESLDGFSFVPLLEVADQYSLIWDLLSHLRRGWSTATREGSEIQIAAKPELIPGASVGDRILFSPDPPDLLVNPNFDLRNLLDEARARGIKSTQFLLGLNLLYRRFEYRLPPALVRKHASERECLMAHLWIYNPKITIGRYTISDFRDFWRCLSAVASLHRYLCEKSTIIGVADGALQDLILVKSRKDWAREMSAFSALPVNKAQCIIDDLTFSPVKREGQKRVDVTLQPFLPLSHDRLCLSPWLVFSANAEANLWSLKISKNSDNFSRHTDTKEAQWLIQLSNFLSSVDLECLKFNVPTGCGDIDTLFWDRKDNFAIAVQLKSHQPPDRLNEVAQEIKELEKGVSQVEKALDWISANPDPAQSRLQDLLLRNTTLKGLVLTQGTTGGGFVKHQHVPIAGERLLKWVIGAPGNRSLRQFWKIANEPDRYLPKAGIHYHDEVVTAQFAGLTFISSDGGLSLGRPWLPESDIQFD